MSVFRKIRSSRNSTVVKDELQFGDCDVAKVRVEGVVSEPRRVLVLLTLDDNYSVISAI